MFNYLKSLSSGERKVTTQCSLFFNKSLQMTLRSRDLPVKTNASRSLEKLLCAEMCRRSEFAIVVHLLRANISCQNRIKNLYNFSLYILFKALTHKHHSPAYVGIVFNKSSWSCNLFDYSSKPIVARKMINLIWCFNLEKFHFSTLETCNVNSDSLESLSFMLRQIKSKFSQQTTGEDTKCLARNP